MADVDEAVITSMAAGGVGHDLDDETQDFRFLSHLASHNTQASLPKRGEKDFEPHGSASQESALAAAQDAMHVALSQPRVHAPKAHIYGVLGSSADDKVAVLVANPRTVHFRTMGQADSVGIEHLNAEEALYLLERGSLEVKCTVTAAGGAETVEASMSLQSAYALLMGPGGVSPEEYAVYASLKRSGYIVIRPQEKMINNSLMTSYNGYPNLAGYAKTWQWFSEQLAAKFLQQNGSNRLGPLVKPGLYRNYSDIYTQLSLVPFHNPSIPSSAGKQAKSSSPSTSYPLDRQPRDMQCTFWVWKPSQTFRKSAPRPPDYRVLVVDARTTDLLTLESLDTLLGQTPLTPPSDIERPQLYQRLRHGWRSAIVAVVDCGIVSYIRVADAAFGNERLDRDFKKRPPATKGKKRG